MQSISYIKLVGLYKRFQVACPKEMLERMRKQQLQCIFVLKGIVWHIAHLLDLSKFPLDTQPEKLAGLY